jgi:enoyl-CoA hydratase
MGTWSLELNGRVAVLTFTRPPRNYFDFASMAELGDHLEKLAANSDEVGVVMLTGGVDGYFIAHGELADLQRAGRGEAPGGIESWLRVTRLVAEMPQPVVAAIDGQAWGAGNELAIACTLRVGSTRTHLGNPEVKIGIIPGGGGSQRLPRLIGPGFAADAILRGRVFTAEEALRIGWLNEVLPVEGFVDAAVAWCQEMAVLPATALYAAKKALVRGASLPLDEGIAMETEMFLDIAGSSPELGQRIAAMTQRP